MQRKEKLQISSSLNNSTTNMSAIWISYIVSIGKQLARLLEIVSNLNFKELHVCTSIKKFNFDIEKQFNIKVSYTKAWRAREATLESVRGSFKESYIMLPSYC